MTAETGYLWTRDRWHVRAREWILFALAYGFRFVTRPIGVWTLGAAAAPIGALVARLVPGFRRRASANLALVWSDRPAAERRRLIGAAGASFARLCVEYAHLDRFARGLKLDIRGAEVLAEARAAGRGAVLVTAHYGNWEAVRLAARAAGIECGIIYRAFNNRYLDRFTLRLIRLAGEPVLQKGRTGMRELVRHVRAGGAILILVDQRNSGAPFLPFLGQPAETVTAAAALAKATRAPLVTTVARRDSRARSFEVRFERPVEVSDPEAAMAEVNARIGAWIEEEPDQWFWFHRRWRANRRSRAQ